MAVYKSPVDIVPVKDMTVATTSPDTEVLLVDCLSTDMRTAQ